MMNLIKKLTKGIKRSINQLTCNHKFYAEYGDIGYMGGSKIIHCRCLKCGLERVLVDCMPSDVQMAKIDLRSCLKLNNNQYQNVSDGYHTFKELYYHRMILTASLFNQDESAWKSTKHSDGEIEDGWFIVGINTKNGQVTYHYQMEHWNRFKVKELDRAPKWDGVKSTVSIEKLYKHFDKK